MNIFILIIIWILIIYNLSGIYLLIPLIICVINISFSTFLLVFNPDSYYLRIVRLLSIFVILIIIFSQLNILQIYFKKWL
jgi:hypothetical protein